MCLTWSYCGTGLNQFPLMWTGVGASCSVLRRQKRQRLDIDRNVPRYVSRIHQASGHCRVVRTPRYVAPSSPAGSIGSIGDALDNELIGSVIGSFETESIRDIVFAPDAYPRCGLVVHLSGIELSPGLLWTPQGLSPSSAPTLSAPRPIASRLLGRKAFRYHHPRTDQV